MIDIGSKVEDFAETAACIRNAGVVGSNPIGGTIFLIKAMF